jgi:hypothetical protein
VGQAVDDHDVRRHYASGTELLADLVSKERTLPRGRFRSCVRSRNDVTGSAPERHMSRFGVDVVNQEPRLVARQRASTYETSMASFP